MSGCTCEGCLAAHALDEAMREVGTLRRELADARAANAAAAVDAKRALDWANGEIARLERLLEPDDG